MKPLAMTEDNFNAVIRAADPNATDIKTETRRLLTVKGMTQNDVNQIESFYKNSDGNWIGVLANEPDTPEWIKEDYPRLTQVLKPRMKIGDRAYLKEPTQVLCTNPEDSTNIESCNVAYFWGDKLTTYEGISDHRWADLAEGDSEKLCNRKTGIYSKQGAMFMLKSFARHSVEILDVRVERLLDITDEGAIAEGIKSFIRDEGSGFDKVMYWDYVENSFLFTSPKASYMSEIVMLHGREIAHSNPWLWVYKFRYLTGDDNA